MIENFIKQAQYIDGIEVFENYSLTTSTTLGLISEARVFVKVFDENGLEDVISKIKRERLDYLILGKGLILFFPIKYLVLLLSLVFHFQ